MQIGSFNGNNKDTYFGNQKNTVEISGTRYAEGRLGKFNIHMAY